MIEVQIGEAASYAAAGVDIDAGDEISRMWFEASRQTFSNRDGKFGQLAIAASRFTGSRDIDMDVVQGTPGLVLSVGVDGVGTKTELAERGMDFRFYRDNELNKESAIDHRGIFYDVGAMVLDDFSRDGKEPIALATLFDVNNFKFGDDIEYSKAVVEQLCLGMVAMAKEANVVVLNGESAELGSRVGGIGRFNYNLGGFGIGLAHRSRVLTGEKVTPGDSIVAFQEQGFRSNGLSLVRKVMAAEYGDEWHADVKRLLPEMMIERLLKPSRLYTPLFVDLHGGYDLTREPAADIHALVHVTGGGIPGKLQRVLGVTGHGAVLEDLFLPGSAMNFVLDTSQRHARLATDDAAAYQSLNMGNGALAICPRGQSDNVIEVAEEHGVAAREVGTIVENPGIELVSQGPTHRRQRIRFVPKGA